MFKYPIWSRRASGTWATTHDQVIEASSAESAAQAYFDEAVEREEDVKSLIGYKILVEIPTPGNPHEPSGHLIPFEMHAEPTVKRIKA